MQIKNNRLLESILSLSLLNALNMALPLITLPYIIRVVGMANYGAYSIVYSLIQYVLMISAYGFGFSATKQIAQNRNNSIFIMQILNSTIAARLLLAFISAIFLFIIAWIVFSKTYAYMFLLGIGIIVGDALNPVWLFQGMEKMRYMTIVNVVCKLVFTILIFTCIRKQQDYIYITFLNSAGYIFAGIISLIIACRTFALRLCIPSITSVFYQLKDGWYIFLSTVFMSFYRDSNVLILGLFTSDFLVGMYAGAEKIVKASQSIASPISNALYPHLAEAFRDGKQGGKINRIYRIAVKMGFFLLIISCLIYFLASPISVLLLSIEDQKIIELIRIMTPVILFGGLNYILGIVGLVNLGYQRSFFKYVMFSGIFSILFLLLTVNYWNVISASISMCLSEILLFIMCFLKLRNNNNL